MIEKQITDFSNSIFQSAFKQYFQELGIIVSDWEDLFKQMNKDKETIAFIRYNNNNDCIGFIQVKPTIFSNDFFEEPYGFIRELWINKKYRLCGHGAALMKLAEEYFYKNGIYKSILTTSTAPEFYKKLDYKISFSCKAKNNDPVYIKQLKFIES